MKRLVQLVLLIALSSGAAAVAKERHSSQSVEVKASAAEIWAVLIAPDSWAKDNPAVKRSRLVSGDGEAVGSKVEFYPVIGKRRPLKVKLTLAKSEKHKKLEFFAKIFGVNAVMGFEIKEKDGGCTLTNYETVKGLMVIAISQADMDREHRLWVEAIKTKLEKGK